MLKGAVFSAEHRFNLSQAHMGNKSALGHKVTKKARKAMSIGHIGKVASEQTKQRMSLVHKGVVLGSPPKERRIRIRKSVLAYYAKDPANRMKCAHPMSEKGRLANIAAHTGKKHHLGFKHTQKMKDAMSKLKMGKPNGVVYTPELRKKFSESRKKTLRDPEYWKRRIEKGNIYTSKQEDALALILDRMGIEYVRQYTISDIAHVYPSDFYVDKYKMVIEVDGRYWHGDRRPIQKELDHIRNNEMKSAGYHVIRFWGDEIKNSEYIEHKLNSIIIRIDRPSNIIPFPMVS